MGEKATERSFVDAFKEGKIDKGVEGETFEMIIHQDHKVR